MIQDIAPHVYHNEYKPIPPTADSFILSFEDKKILFHQAGAGDGNFLSAFSGTGRKASFSL